MLHPQARALLDLITAKNLPAMQDLAPVEARAYYRDRRALTQPEPPEVASAVDRSVATGDGHALPVRCYRPLDSDATAVMPCLVYFHGGGWTIGDLDTHDTLCRELANRAGIAVVAVDYRMGPEHRFPAAVEDCIAATRWVAAEASALRIDPGRLAVGGDSAGGNLAAVVAIALRDAGHQPPLRFQLLVYPQTDMRNRHPSHATNGTGYLLESETIAYYQRHYLGDDAARRLDWRASPLLHPDLARLPPALVLTAGFDPLRDEGLEYADRLSAAGVRATHVCFERQIHGFLPMGRVIDEANTGVAFCAMALMQALA
jgi:acetyl esterase